MSAHQLLRAQPATLPVSMLSIPEDDIRRTSHRVRTVYRVVRIETTRDQGLGRVRNMSDGGMKLSLNMPVTLGDRVRVALTDAAVLDGRVVWINGNDCGLQFEQNVDSIFLLRQTAQHCRAADARSPRLRTGLMAVATSENGTRSVKVHDVSLRGMKLTNDGTLTPGLPVKVSFRSGLERRGVVRWANGTLAGVMLIEQFAVEELGALSAL